MLILSSTITRRQRLAASSFTSGGGRGSDRGDAPTRTANRRAGRRPAVAPAAMAEAGKDGRWTIEHRRERADFLPGRTDFPRDWTDRRLLLRPLPFVRPSPSRVIAPWTAVP